MNKAKRYKFVWVCAKDFMRNLIKTHKELSNQILQEHLQYKPKIASLSDINERLLGTLPNRNMMASVIKFSDRKCEMKKILCKFNPKEIILKYPSEEILFKEFKRNFEIKNVNNKRNLWRQFSKGIISGSKFLASFKDKSAFVKFIAKQDKDKLPVLLQKRIEGIGFALACNFLKEIGYRDYSKPDRHLRDIFYKLGLCKSRDQYEIYKSICEMADTVGKDAYTVDKMFWLICSGKFHLKDIRIERNKKRFIKECEKALLKLDKK